MEAEKKRLKAFSTFFTLKPRGIISEHVPADTKSMEVLPSQEMAAVKGTQE